MADVEINLESNDSKELLKCGHHAFITKDYGNAAAALGKATQIMAQEHGDEHDSLGEVYLHYAKALLELSRDESEPLGDAIPQGEDEESEEEEGEEAGEENEEKEGEEKKNDEEVKEKVEEKSEEKVEETKKDEEKESKTKEDEPALTNGNHSEAGPSTSNGTNEENGEATEENIEPSDLQIAWEVLEVAKKIFAARGENGRELLSQTHILLGEVGMESENFNDAVSDIKAGLELQEILYEKTNRKLAESYYKLGMAQATIANFDDAIKCFEKSIDILKARIDMLKSNEKGDDAGTKEIAEMEELLPEIQEKINDMNTAKEETAKVKAEITEACSNKLEKENDANKSSPNTKEVKDISHLVKRKRKMEETENSCQPTKKPTP